MEPRVVLIGKPDCHLCENARLTIAKVCDDLGITWGELSILDDAQLADQYFESIPVTLIDGKVHDKWRVDENRLRAALS
ncbi:MAG: glutaredoxin family protein [Actinomycetes bacterium]